MRTDDEASQWQRLDHARWRVGAFRCILNDHLSMPCSRQDEEWEHRLSVYEKRVRDAEVELDLLEALWNDY